MMVSVRAGGRTPVPWPAGRRSALLTLPRVLPSNVGARAAPVTTLIFCSDTAFPRSFQHPSRFPSRVPGTSALTLGRAQQPSGGFAFVPGGSWVTEDTSRGFLQMSPPFTADVRFWG